MNTIRITPKITMGTLRGQLHKMFGGDTTMMLLGESEDKKAFEIISSRLLTPSEATTLAVSPNVRTFTQSGITRKDEHKNV
jgi:hypothetical protein